MVWLFIGLFLFVLFTIICWDIQRKWTALNPADKTALQINTFDGLRSPYHPSVLYFEDGWNGWKYWMAETPYSQRTKPYGDRNECPSIHVSNDGEHWTEVPGLHNPLEDLSQRQVKELDYFSDPCLVLGPNNRLECWYRLTERRGEKEFRTRVSLRRRWTENGVDWSAVEIMDQLDENQEDKGLGRVVVSSALLYDEKEGYRMWYVNMETAGCPDYQGVSYSTSKDGFNWSDAKEVRFEPSIHQWHIDLKLIEGTYYMTIFNFEDVSIWSSKDGIDFKYLCTPAKPTYKPFSVHSGLYKSSLIKDKEGYKLYVGSNDGVDTFVSLLKGSDPTNLELCHIRQLGFSNFINRYFFFQKRRIKFVISRILG